jgi:hypothetical protein
MVVPQSYRKAYPGTEAKMKAGDGVPTMLVQEAVAFVGSSVPDGFRPARIERSILVVAASGDVLAVVKAETIVVGLPFTVDTTL